jgi:predicted glycosyltransferase
MKRLLMYSQDGHGLGHLRRSLNIAREVRSRSRHCDVLIVADSPAVSIAGSEPGIELLKLPTIIKTGDSAWRNRTLGLPVRQLVKLRSQLLLDIATDFRPEAILVDHMPVGAMGELKPLLDYASTLHRPPKLFLGLRDILDRPAVIREVWTRVGAYDYLPLYDAVLVYGDRGIYDASSAYDLAAHAREVLYCNYVSPRRAVDTLGCERRRPLVLMMGGGGADAFPLAEMFVQAVSALGPELGADAVLLTGPNMAPRQRERLRPLGGVRIESSYRDATEWIREASAIVTMAGYNSLCEVMTWQRKAIVVPRRGPSAEQQMRTNLFSARSLVRRVPAANDTKRFGNALVRLLRDDGVPDLSCIPKLDGAQVAASVLLERTPGRRRMLNTSATPVRSLTTSGVSGRSVT